MSLASEPQRRRSKPKRASLAEDVIDWIQEVCIIPEGKYFGQPVKLLQFQKDIIIIQIYDNPVVSSTIFAKRPDFLRAGQIGLLLIARISYVTEAMTQRGRKSSAAVVIDLTAGYPS